MEGTVLTAMTGNELLSSVTATKSFRYSAYKNKDPRFFQKVVPILVQMMSSNELDLK
jgi:hypothetical protein